MSPPRTPLQATRAGQALGDAHSMPPATNAERRGQRACPSLQCRAYAVADAELSEQAAPDARRTTHRCCHQPHARLRPSPGCCPPARAARPPQHHLPSLVRLYEAELGPCTRAPRAAAAIAVPHEKWGERPLLIVVPRAGCTPQPDALREFCRGKMADWSIPDRVVIADSIPHGATGKVLKAELRRIYAAPPA